MRNLPRAWVLALVVLAAVACTGGNGNGEATETPRPDPGAPAVDLTRLPLGNGRVSQVPEVGALYGCGEVRPPVSPPGRPWVAEDGTWNATIKPVVLDDETIEPTPDIRVVLAGDLRRIVTNGLPSHLAGAFPVDPEDPAHEFDPNPYAMVEKALQFELTRVPSVMVDPGCVESGSVVGVLLTGSLLYAALERDGTDALAYSVFDYCDGHVNEVGIYHYHAASRCTADEWNGGHSKLIGYALDGFGIYGHYNDDGAVITNEDLDPCHGHTHEIEWDGEMRVMYHYHATWEYPYVVGCFRGKPVEIDPTQLQ